MLTFPSVVLFCCALTVVIVQAVPEGRIVGGEDAVAGQFPHQVSLRISDQHLCGGSIISSNYVLTAGHCVTRKDKERGVYITANPDVYSILAGTTDLLSDGVVRQVAHIKVHEDYSFFNGVKNDIALLQLLEPLTFSKYIQPIALASAEPPSGSPVAISGWGQLGTNGGSPIDLQWNVVYAQGHCYASLELLCLAHKENNGACSGDSGGPAVFNGELVGVAGIVIRVCGSDFPDGYANVFYYLDWIKKNSDL